MLRSVSGGIGRRDAPRLEKAGGGLAQRGDGKAVCHEASPCDPFSLS